MSDMGTMRAARSWQRIESAPEHREVWTRIADDHGERNVRTLVRQGNLWFYPDKSMYVYYTPTHWSPT